MLLAFTEAVRATEGIMGLQLQHKGKHFWCFSGY